MTSAELIKYDDSCSLSFMGEDDLKYREGWAKIEESASNNEDSDRESWAEKSRELKLKYKSMSFWDKVFHSRDTRVEARRLDRKLEETKYGKYRRFLASDASIYLNDCGFILKNKSDNKYSKTYIYEKG